MGTVATPMTTEEMLALPKGIERWLLDGLPHHRGTRHVPTSRSCRHLAGERSASTA
jgi:hypothetical protein